MYEDFDITDEVASDNTLLENNKNMEKQYSFLRGLFKGLVSLVLFALPVVLASIQNWLNLTIGGVLVVVLNWLKFRYNNLK